MDLGDDIDLNADKNPHKKKNTSNFPARHIQSQPDLTKVMRILLIPAGDETGSISFLATSKTSDPRFPGKELHADINHQIMAYANTHRGLYRENAFPLRFEPVLLNRLLTSRMPKETKLDSGDTVSEQDVYVLNESFCFPVKVAGTKRAMEMVLRMMQIFDGLLTHWEKENRAGRGQKEGIIHAIVMPGVMPHKAVDPTAEHNLEDKAVFDKFMEGKATPDNLLEIEDIKYVGRAENVRNSLPFIFARMVEARPYWRQRSFQWRPTTQLYDYLDFRDGAYMHIHFNRVNRVLEWEGNAMPALINMHPAIQEYKFKQAEDSEGKMLPIRYRPADSTTENKETLEMAKKDVGEAVDLPLNENVKKHIRSFLLGRYKNNPMMHAYMACRYKDVQ